VLRAADSAGNAARVTAPPFTLAWVVVSMPHAPDGLRATPRLLLVPGTGTP
jgi:hypothetical protein